MRCRGSSRLVFDERPAPTVLLSAGFDFGDGLDRELITFGRPFDLHLDSLFVLAALQYVGHLLAALFVQLVEHAVGVNRVAALGAARHERTGARVSLRALGAFAAFLEYPRGAGIVHDVSLYLHVLRVMIGRKDHSGHHQYQAEYKSSLHCLHLILSTLRNHYLLERKRFAGA